MVLVIDNYDSFVYNLARYVEELQHSARVFRNDAINCTDIAALKPSHILLSPGPCTPNEAGICLNVIKTFAATIPILGVCLGHQAIAQAFGAKIIRAQKPIHGKADTIHHTQTGIFINLPNPLTAARYHSLIVDETTLPKELTITARSPHGEIMALQHQNFPVYGVQFHPESILTPQGQQLLQNFLQTESR